MSATDPSMGSAAMNAGGSSQAMIDPTQIQKVFGTEATLVDLKSLGTDETRRLQQSLKDRGLYQGTVDGVFGPQTRAALSALISQQYALNQRLINQGQITGPVATSIGLDTQGVTPVTGTDLSAPRQQQPMPSNAGQQRQQAPQNRNSPTYPQAPQTGESDMQPAPQNPR
jgi:peptidoglycan hydrolase-like protein with peptidoglycan-binding domain